MFLDSSNGVGPEDIIPVLPGGHGHLLQLGFSSNGFYQVTFRVEGRLAGASTNLLAAGDAIPLRCGTDAPGVPAPARLEVTGVRAMLWR